MSSRGLNRRGHLSTKVPNVKLRPSSSAVPGKKREASPLNAMDEELLNRAMAGTEDEELSSAALRSTRKPWERVVITFTGVEDKPRLAEMAKQLGATIESALTISVTHIVATGFGSAKYLYAVEHRLPVMRPSWIEETHAKWVGAEEVDVIQSMEGQKLLAFEGLTISISGIEPLERRKQIVHHITTNGGTYAKDLDRTATHLVTAQPTNIRAPSEKVKWAVKELAVRDGQRRAGKKVDKEDMKIVYEDWIWDCVGFEGRWKEDWYDARKVRRANRIKYEEVISGQAKALMEQAIKVEAAVKEEPALLKKRKRDALDNLVGDIISTAVILPTGRTPDDAENDIKPIKSELNGMSIDPTPEISGRRPDLDTPTRIDRKPSMLHSTRSNAFASAGPSKLSRDISADITNTSSSSIPSSVPQHRPVINGEQPKPIFAGMKFTPVMADNTDTLVAALRAHGGEVVDRDQWEAGEKTDYVIVRLYASLRPDLDQVSPEARPQVVTECWIEGCCYEQQLIPLDSHIVFRPLVGSFPIPGAAGLRVHLSGFSTENTVYLKRLMKAIGITISDKLNRQTTHLVCAQPVGNKYNKALEWNVVPVRDSWVLAMGRNAALEPDESHRHGLTETAPTESKKAEKNGKEETAQSVKNEKENDEPIRQDTDVDMGSTSNNSLSRQPTSTSHAGLLDTDHPMSSSSPSVSAMRKLKLTPTHIDDQSLNPKPNSASRSTSMTTVTVPTTFTESFPLSPPKQGTERLLNQATGLPTRRVHSEADAIANESIESKLSRTSSVPASAGSGLEKGKQDIRSTSLTGLGRSDMSEMLKQLQQGDITSSTGSQGGQSTTGIPRSSKPLRRARPSAASASTRLRTSLAYPTSPREGSEAGDTTANDTTLRFSSSPPPMLPCELGMGGLGEMGGYDESVRVNYVDPAAEKERKKLLDAMRKGAKAASRDRGEDVVGSAKKRRI